MRGIDTVLLISPAVPAQEIAVIDSAARRGVSHVIKVTYTDTAEELSAALGHPVEYRQISPGEHRAAMIAAGIPEAVETSNAPAFGLIADGDAAWLSDDVKSIAGTVPRPLRTFIADHVQAFT